jgi:glycosyltransferase involved in cell wall biosynthesis
MMETQTVHPDFVRRLNGRYHECWVPTSWNREVLRSSGLNIPCYIAPLGVDPDVYKPGPHRRLPAAELLTTSRAGLLESPEGLLFITTYQPTFRKGINTLLDAFERAFSEDPQAALVLATTLYAPSSIEGTLRERGLKSRVYLLRGKFSEGGLADIYRSCDAYVSASLGEGWNLPLCEAAACGLPVIAGRHSAHAELFTDDCAYFFEPDGYEPVRGAESISPWFEDQRFAHFGDCSIKQLAGQLRNVKDHRAQAFERGARASERMRTRYSWSHAAAVVTGLLQR